jgi:hypothetical protein
MPARKIAQILDSAPGLQDLAEASRRIEQLQCVYLEAIPAELSRASRIGWARAGVISVTAGNGAAAAKVRQLAPRVLEHLRRRGFEFNSMRIEVQVSQNPPHSPRREPKPLSDQALATIDAVLTDLPESPLKDALRRLGRRRRPTA